MPLHSSPLRLCQLDDLPLLGARGFDPHGTGADTLFIVRLSDGPRAFVNRCPHQGAALEYRKDRFLSADGRYIVCHAHGALFDLDSGRCNHGACLGQSLEAVPCWIEDGWVWLEERG